MLQEEAIQKTVKAACSGEEQAWNILYQQYYPHLYATALSLCKDPSNAKDLVQDSFITAYLNLPKLKVETAFSTWIKKILIHTFYRSYHYNTQPVALSTLPVEKDLWWENELGQKHARLSEQSQLYKIISLLSEDIRSTLLLRYFSSFQTYEEIASILSIPVGTVRSRLNQAKQKLLQHWQRYKDNNIIGYKECEEWNHFYLSTLAGIHKYDVCKNRFINHLQKEIQIIFLGKANKGSSIFEAKIVDDRQFGSWLIPINVVSSGNVSVVDVKHFNAPEHPNHCPANSVLVLYRNNEKASRMHMYY